MGIKMDIDLTEEEIRVLKIYLTLDIEEIDDENKDEKVILNDILRKLK